MATPPFSPTEPLSGASTPRSLLLTPTSTGDFIDLRPDLDLYAKMPPSEEYTPVRRPKLVAPKSNAPLSEYTPGWRVSRRSRPFVLFGFCVLVFTVVTLFRQTTPTPTESPIYIQQFSHTPVRSEGIQFQTHDEELAALISVS
jgi:hypothetical protein